MRAVGVCAAFGLLDRECAADVVRDGGADRDAAQPDGDPGEVERVEHQLDPASDQGGVDPVGVALQRHERGAAGAGAAGAGAAGG